MDYQEQANIFNQLGEIKSAGNPVVCGAFTDWQPRQMVKLLDFLDTHVPPDEKLTDRNIFKMLLADGTFSERDGIYEFEDLRKAHHDIIADYRKRKLTQLYEKWGTVLQDHFQFKKPFLVNSHYVRDLPAQDVWILPAFINSGRQAFVIQSGKTPSTLQLYSKIVNFREDEIIVNQKEKGASTLKRVFKKDQSVFAQWMTDTEQTRDQCMEHDAAYWKMDRLVKSLDEKAAVERILTDKMLFLKDVYIELAAETAYPYVSQIGFANFCAKCDMLDKNLNIGGIDR